MNPQASSHSIPVFLRVRATSPCLLAAILDPDHNISVTKFHKLGGLKQEECIISQFWRPTSKTKVCAGPRPLRTPVESSLASCGLWAAILGSTADN